MEIEDHIRGVDPDTGERFLAGTSAGKAEELASLLGLAQRLG